MNLQTDEDRARAQAVLAAVCEAVDFLLSQELARLENSVRFASERERARDLRRRLRRASQPDH